MNAMENIFVDLKGDKNDEKLNFHASFANFKDQNFHYIWKWMEKFELCIFVVESHVPFYSLDIFDLYNSPS